MQNRCRDCKKTFDVTSQDKQFLEKISPIYNAQKFTIPAPDQCVECRERNRIAFRNERKLYQRKCDLCQKEIIAIHASEKKNKVFCTQCWWSDNWNMEDSGKEYDFSRPFFEQFKEILTKTPLLNLLARNNVNSDYVNQETDDKNCYLNAGGHFNEDCYYNTYSFNGKNNADNYWINQCELCYMCSHCDQCYHSTHLTYCQNVRDSEYCFDCKDCDHCFGSYGLRHKQYYFFNEELSKDDYVKRVQEATFDHHSRLATQEKVKTHFLKFPHQATQNVQCENVTGDRLVHSHNASNCFDSEQLQDCKNVFIAMAIKDSQDLSSFGWGELLYSSASSMKGYQVYFSSHCCETENVFYSYLCFNVKNVFGCAGIHHREYCILNKQYTKEAYLELVPRIIAHMQSTDEWGKFFPMSISPFAYNESIAQDYFPRTREQVEQEGLHWYDQHMINRYSGPTVQIPNRIQETTNEIVKQILTCEGCSKNYKIIPQELQFYRQLNLPIPHHCLDCRNQVRLKSKPPRILWSRECNSCHMTIQTTYAPERPELVVCERCYLKATY